MLNGQLDLFDIPNEVAERNEPNTKKPIRKEKLKKEIELKSEALLKSEEMECPPEVTAAENLKVISNENEKFSTKMMRPFPIVEIGDKVKVTGKIDNSPENDGYFQMFKGTKGIVTDIKEVKSPADNRYQYNVWVTFKGKINEIGVFYDLELTKTEDKM